MTRKGKHQQLTVLPCWITCSAFKALLLAILIHAEHHVNGQHQDNFHCTQEGYHPHPTDCHIYYRCVSWGDDRPLTKFNFECGPGTVFSHAKGDICVHPRDSERPECSESGNDIDSGMNQPDYDSNHYPSNSWPTQRPSESPSTHSPEENEVYEPSSTAASSSSSLTPKPVNYPPPSNLDNDQCQEEGFLADSHDCSKFIRCVDAGQGSFARYEFSCGVGTIWDPENEVCNHDWAVKRLDCAINPDSETSTDHPDSDHASGNNDATSPQPPCHTEKPPVTSYPGYPSPSDGSAYPSSTGVASLAPPSPSYLPSSQATPKPTSGQSPTVEPAPSFTSSPSDNNKGEGNPPRPGTEASGTLTCSEEGFFADPNSCNKFYRCVQGDKGLQKYEFECGEGTAWDASVQTCNYNYAVPGCGKGESSSSTSVPSNEEKTTNLPSSSSTEAQPTSGDSSSSVSTDSSSPVNTDQTESTSERAPETEKTSEVPATSEANLTTKEPTTSNAEEIPETSATSSAMATSSTMTSSAVTSSTMLTTKKIPSSTASTPSNPSDCQEEGFFPDPEDCRKFIRCVSSNDGYLPYKFDCAPGTAWDQTLLTCNYIAQVPSCGSEANEIPSGPEDGTQTTGKPTTHSTPSTTTTKREESSTQSLPPSTDTAGSSEESSTNNATTAGAESSTKPTGDCSTKKPTGDIVCNEAGFFANPSQCDKFYRCVDNGNGFNVYNFDCPPGTIFDPSISVCNYPESVYPSRDCSSGGSSSSEPTTVEAITEAESETSMTTEEQGGDSSGTTEATTEAGTETTETPSATTNGAGETQATEESSTDESTVETATTEASGSTQTTESPTAMTEVGTTMENQESTTASVSPVTETGDTEASMMTPCPIGNLTDEQIVLVCPTGFKRHPKYCNMFYQCSNEEEMKVKILVLACPEGTIFDEENIKCSPESENSQSCTTEMASARFYRQLESTSVSPIRVSRERLCPEDGHYPYQNGCINAFYKCQRDSRSRLQGYLYKCPQDFVYWSVSRRCERASRLSACSEDNYEENTRLNRWNLPVENKNLSARSLRLRGKV